MKTRTMPLAQSTLLRLVAQASQKPGGIWVPRVRSEWMGEPWAPSPGRFVAVHGAGVAGAYAALVRRGWIEANTLAPYAATITPSGFAQAENERGRPLEWAER